MTEAEWDSLKPGDLIALVRADATPVRVLCVSEYPEHKRKGRRRNTGIWNIGTEGVRQRWRTQWKWYGQRNLYRIVSRAAREPGLQVEAAWI